MRTAFVLALVYLSLIASYATSDLFTLEQKVAACTAILRVSVTAVTPPKTNSLIDPAICKAKVLEVLKGPDNLKEVQFRFNAYGCFPPDKLPEMVGKEYIVFLHEPPLPNSPSNQLWAFEGSAGIRPVADAYQEYHISPDNKVATETFSHSNFVAAIRAFSSQQGLKKK